MSTFIGIKDFRQSLAKIAEAVKKGHQFIIMRRSKPAFMVVPYPQEEEPMDLPRWKTVVDFTEGGKKRGIPAAELYKVMKELIEKNAKMAKIRE